VQQEHPDLVSHAGNLDPQRRDERAGVRDRHEVVLLAVPEVDLAEHLAQVEPHGAQQVR
jgi:hypothetical protein